jgi:hypothetical protein
MTTSSKTLFDMFVMDVFNMGEFDPDLYANSLVRKSLRACFNANESVEYTVELINYRMGW